MTTPNSNEKSINNLKIDAVDGTGIIGGGKAVPVITVDFNDTPVDVMIPGATPPKHGDDNYSIDEVIKPNGGTLELL